MILAACLLFNPIGTDFVRNAFFSSEQLARNIAQPIVLTSLAVVAVLGLVEWAVRRSMIKRRALRDTTR